MLRSIFSLIHRILDNGDKTYNNTKSRAVIYCSTNLDNSVTMDLEIDGEHRQRLKAVKSLEKPMVEPKKNSFQIKTEQGDTVTCTHSSEVKIVPTRIQTAEPSEPTIQPIPQKNRVSFSNTQKLDGEANGDEGTGTNVHELMKNFSNQKVELSKAERDQISALMDQINKMKSGLERLQQIATQFNCSENFKQDVNFLVNQLKPALQKAHDESKDAVSQNM